MGNSIIKDVSYRVWDDEKQEERVFSGALAIDTNNDSDQVLEVCADDGSFEIKIEDIPLLIKVLQEFMK